MNVGAGSRGWACAALAATVLASCGEAAPASGGGGGADMDGAAGAAGGPPPDINQVWAGAGCGQALPFDQPPTMPGTAVGYKHWVVMGTGANLTDTSDPTKAEPRTFWVRVPADYNLNHPYRVVFLGQGCGGYQIANTRTYQLFNESMGGTEQAIYVALDLPEDGANTECYDSSSGASSQEWEAFQLFMETVDAHYCADLNRVYVAGYSTGGWLANMWGCYFAGQPTTPRKFAARYHIRAQAVVGGAEPDGQPPCGGPVAAIWIHDQLDAGGPISGDIAALARVGRMNGCDTTYDNPALQAPWHPELPALLGTCKRFQGCPADYPVTFCTTTGNGKTDNSSIAIPAFNRFFLNVEGVR